MTKAEIISQCQDFTEHKADDRLNFQTTLELRIAKFVKEKEFYWRKKIGSFPTVQGQALYVLAGLAKAINGVEQIRRMRILDSSGKGTRVDPVWDDEAVMCAQEDATQDKPTRYTMEPGATGVIRLTKVPNGVYTIRFSYLGAYQPNAASPEFTDAVPEALHFALVDGLKMDIMEFLYGAESDKYTVSASVYQDSVEKCYMPVDFTSERVDTFAGDALGSIRHEAVRSC